jgi:hypothetical protein
MNFLKYELNLGAQDAVKVVLSKQANVRLMDYSNFQAYRSGRRHTYYGGHATVSPFVVRLPHAGQWYLAIDLGGYGGSVNASVSVI